MSAAPPPSGSARTAVLRLLARRDYTKAELTERLLARGYAEPAVDSALRALEADGTVDDRRAARAHVRTASRVKGRGRLRIARELDARGIARDIARDALDTLSPADDTEAVRRFLQKRRVPRQLSPADRRKIFQQLLRRGFAVDTIARALTSDGNED
jgi:regulatory protein